MEKDPVSRLRRLVVARKLVFLVGAGVSMQVTGNDPSSSWAGFMEHGIKLAEQRTATSPDVSSWVASVRQDVRSGDPDRRLVAEDQVLTRLGGPDSDGVAQWLRESVGSLTPVDRSPVEALAALGVPLLTLNYDNLLEEITRRPAITWQQPATMRDVALGDEQGIIHLHGQWREPSSVVLGSVRYARITSEKAAQELVNSLSYNNALVLVGFGAPLDTMQFEPLRSWLTASDGPPHFRLVSTGEHAQFSSPTLVEERRHLQLVDYGSRYDDLAPFLQSLRPRAEIGWRRYLAGASFFSVLFGVLALFAALGVLGVYTVLCAVGVACAAQIFARILARGRATPPRVLGLLASLVAAVVFGFIALSSDSSSDRASPAISTKRPLVVKRSPLQSGGQRQAR